MGVCLSTSLSEGNPNNVIEAMAKGIKPVVHAWPGAEDQFPEDTASPRSTRPRADHQRRRTTPRLPRLGRGEVLAQANIERAVDLALAA
jgi:hypothetical protein